MKTRPTGGILRGDDEATRIVVDLPAALREPLHPALRRTLVRLETARALRKASGEIESAAYTLAGEASATLVSEIILLAARLDQVSERLSRRSGRN